MRARDHIAASPIRSAVYHPRVRLVLASASPRRRELLARGRLRRSTSIPADVDERRLAGRAARRTTSSGSRVEKARGRRRAHPGARRARRRHGRRRGRRRARQARATPRTRRAMLRRLSGRAHEVLTGVALAWPGGDRRRRRAHARLVGRADRGRDRAGTSPAASRWTRPAPTRIQGLASRFIPRIEGSYSNVVGLPVATVVQLLGMLARMQSRAYCDADAGYSRRRPYSGVC